MVCLQCNHAKVYRKSLCRKCYKQFRLQQFHCIYGSCYRPIFCMTLCKFHYRSSQMTCLLCKKNIYCRSLCKKHYQQQLSVGIFTPEPKCIKCTRRLYVNSLCIYHFKKKYDFGCIMVGCNGESYKKGFCCKHYFKQRRDIENKTRI